MSLKEAVRGAAKAAVWSEGLRWARLPSAVQNVRNTPGQVELLVRGTGTTACTVVLYPDDEEWTSDCCCPLDPCAHVVAAVLVQSGTVSDVSEGVAAPPTPGAGVAPAPRARRLGYRFLRDGSSLVLVRFLLGPDGTETLLRQSLNAPASAPLRRELILRESDLSLDRLIGGRLGRYAPATTWKAVCAALEGAALVRLEERELTVLTEPLLPVAQIVDRGEELELCFLAPPVVDEILSPGVALCGNTLRLLGETELTGLRLERLPRRERFVPSRFGELAARILPELERRLPVSVQTDRLPRRSRRLLPRIVFELKSEPELLVAIARLVYGDPVVARVENDRVLQMGDVAPKRDHDAEKQLMLELRDQLGMLLDRPIMAQGLDAARLLSGIEIWQAQRGGDDRLLPQHAQELVLDVTIEDGRPRFSFVSSAAAPGSALGAETVLLAHQRGIDKVPMPDGSWAKLPKGWLDQHAATLRDWLAVEHPEKGCNPAAELELGELCRNWGIEAPTGLVDYLSSLRQAQDPESLTARLAEELRPYQRRGIAWLQALSKARLGGILADDMGLGKTVQVLGAIHGRVLVVAPRSVLYHWKNECQRFRPELRVCIYHGPERSLFPEAHLTVTTYALLRSDESSLCELEWDGVVLDEAQNIKNPDSLAAQAAYHLRSNWRVAMSGTPIENRLEELWSQMHFANPGLLGSLSSFRHLVLEPLAAGDASAADRLRRRIEPFILRRLKRDVLPELPPRLEDVLTVELDESERAIYDSLLDSARKELASAAQAPVRTLAVLESLLRLRQAACHCGLLPGSEVTSSSKTERLFELLDELFAEGQRSLVFSQWTSLLDRLEPEFRRRQLPFLRLDGETRDREAVVQAFQTSSEPVCLLASLKAGGTGLNLTAADHVFLMDPWWNPAAEQQAADRAHRLGRTSAVFVHRLVAKDTVEDRVLALQEQKRALGAFVDGVDASTELTVQDYLQLLE